MPLRRRGGRVWGKGVFCQAMLGHTCFLFLLLNGMLFHALFFLSKLQHVFMLACCSVCSLSQ